jgi:serine/threonine protein kinase
MAPEAIREPESVSAASDLYALGAVGWFLLVGRPPFDGQSLIEVCGKHLHTPPLRPSEALGQELALDLEDIVMRCLAKAPTNRPKGARELRRALTKCSVAGNWTEEHAAQWWKEHSSPSPAALPEAAESRTIALDVAARVAGFA